MSWDERAAALVECFQEKALALLSGLAKPHRRSGPAADPQCGLLARQGIH